MRRIRELGLAGLIFVGLHLHPPALQTNTTTIEPSAEQSTTSIDHSGSPQRKQRQSIDIDVRTEAYDTGSTEPSYTIDQIRYIEKSNITPREFEHLVELYECHGPLEVEIYDEDVRTNHIELSFVGIDVDIEGIKMRALYRNANYEDNYLTKPSDFLPYFAIVHREVDCNSLRWDIAVNLSTSD
jgi:hypothetical protein